MTTDNENKSHRNYNQYVHTWVDADGSTHYAVGYWDQAHSYWVCPLSYRTRDTRSIEERSTYISGLPQYPTRRQALRRARYLFGNDKS